MPRAVGAITLPGDALARHVISREPSAADLHAAASLSQASSSSVPEPRVRLPSIRLRAGRARFSAI